MNREGKEERDSSKDISDRSSEDAMDESSDTVGGDRSRQRYDSEGAACSDHGNRSVSCGCC
jgi:hypothetical protein